MTVNESHALRTAFAVRERLMEYFKGSSFANLVDVTNVRTDRMRPNGHRAYDNWEYGVKEPCTVSIGPECILNISKEPATVTFLKRLNESPEFATVKFHIEEFLQEYLPGVKKEYES